MSDRFPKPQKGAIFYEDSSSYATLASYPIARGHVVVVWKKRVLNFVMQIKEGKPVLIVIHEGCLRAIISEMLGEVFNSTKCDTSSEEVYLLDTKLRTVSKVE